MTNLYILMWIYLTYLVVSFWLFNYNILSPSVVFSFSLAIMLCVAYYAATNMEMVFAINMRTFKIFAWAGFVFLATEFIVYTLNTVRHLSSNTPHKIPLKHEPFIIEPRIQWSVTAFLAMSFLLSVVMVYLNTSGGSWSDRMRMFKGLISSGQPLRFYFILSQLYKIGIIITDLFGYIFIYNASLCDIPAKKMISYIADILLFALFSAIVTGARRSPIELFLFLAMIYVTINMRPGGKKKILRLVVKSIPVAIIGFSLFSIAGTLVGRYNSKGGLQNVVEYLCGGLYSFNLRIDEGGTSQVFGLSTFLYIYMIPLFLVTLGLMKPTDYVMYDYFESLERFDMYGNTITIFGRWYKDFDMPGVLIMSCLVSLFFSLIFYKSIIHSQNVYRDHHWARICYCQFMTGLIWAGMDDRIGSMMTVQTVVFMIFMNIILKRLSPHR